MVLGRSAVLFSWRVISVLLTFRLGIARSSLSAVRSRISDKIILTAAITVSLRVNFFRFIFVCTS